MMRGQVTLHNQLEETIFDDPLHRQNEINVKLKVLRILEHFLDLRQDYLLTNFLAFFKQKVVDEPDEQAQKPFNELVDEYYKSLLPNITRTGIKSVDDIYRPKEENAQAAAA